MKCEAHFECRHKGKDGKCSAEDKDLMDGDWGAMFPKAEDTSG